MNKSEIPSPTIMIGLPPESPYSDRAEAAAERFHDRLLAGEYPKLFDPKVDYRPQIEKLQKKDK